MADMGTKEASEKWGVAQRTVEKWCRDGKIAPQPTQDKKGSPWHIQKDAMPPITKRAQIACEKERRTKIS